MRQGAPGRLVRRAHAALLRRVLSQLYLLLVSYRPLASGVGRCEVA